MDVDREGDEASASHAENSQFGGQGGGGRSSDGHSDGLVINRLVRRSSLIPTL